MDPGIQIQAFKPHQVGRIVAIERASFARDAWDRELLLEYFRNAPELFLIAKSSGRIAGYILTVTTPRLRTAELVSIAVDPRVRRTGTATALIDATRSKLRARRIATWWLMVGIENEPAIHLYNRHGFRRVRRVKNYYGAGRDAWRMRLSISGTTRTGSRPQKKEQK